ncbi:MAG: hypothetical protein JRJ39_10750 [Deltaproteobacteria bacterium]|nr:hypothetical protein [Deltaproteobacteria bacterium]MBW1845608.1 hypothetical protein [Deltaproteobacteria bacterium]MBW2364902.1 hypothetical protein [Deltaproteobacteria bacterium]
MIKQQTVFILGAGASMPYDYPSGQKLVDEIKKDLLAEGSLFKLCVRLNFNKSQIRDFAQKLKYSDPKSINAFLERQDDIIFIDLGKVLITLALIEKEIEDNLFSPGNEKWYQDVVDKIKPSSLSEFNNSDDHGNKIVSFLTFNYDRSFDHYLYQSIKNSYPELEDYRKCAEIVNSIPIIHLHGQIGKLPWQTNDSTGRPYTKDFDSLKFIKDSLSPRNPYHESDLASKRHDILNISEQIKIIHEKKLDSDIELQKAHKLLDKANNIYFLGFGYNDDNLRRLKISEISPKIKRNIDGTSHGIGAAKKEHIKKVTNDKINLPEKEFKIVEFLKEKVNFE